MVYYLERHIELDSRQHGPTAMNILKWSETTATATPGHWKAPARRSPRAHPPWDGVLSDIRSAAAKPA